jgi:branched-chain amino acid aminotransferase
MNYVYLNGAILPAAEALIPTTDRGVLLGDGLFETMRSYNGTVFRFSAHMDRLRASAEALKIRTEFTDAHIQDSIATLAEKNGCDDAYVRLTLTRGWEMTSLRLDGDGAPTVILHVRPHRSYAADRYRKGLKLMLSTVRQSSASCIVRHKTLAYLPYLLARQEAVEANMDGAVLLNEAGQVTEESVGNLFFARDGVLHTPPIHCGLLPGITRDVVLECANDAGIPVEDAPIPAGGAFEFEEAFMTNTLMEVMPIRSLDKRPFATKAPGPLTKRIQELFRAKVAAECGDEG